MQPRTDGSGATTGLKSSAGRQRTKFVQVFASAPESAEVAGALASSEFEADTARLASTPDGSARSVVATIVSDAVEGPIDLCRTLPPDRPVVLLASDAGFDLRRAAARAGLHAILKRPIDPIELLRCLKDLDATASRDRPQVVLVDDDRLTADPARRRRRPIGSTSTTPFLCRHVL